MESWPTGVSGLVRAGEADFDAAVQAKLLQCGTGAIEIVEGSGWRIFEDGLDRFACLGPRERSLELIERRSSRE